MLLDDLATIGRDPRGGYTRLAWTSADAAMREWFVARAEGLGLGVEVDRNGNLWAWIGAPGPNALVLGSHLDSVPGGGAFDGPLGIASAFAAIERLLREGRTLTRPVAVVAFADEEGGRFGVACAGSRLLTGALDADTARALVDADGITLAEATGASGIDPAHLGADPERVALIGEAIELHVEQGHLPDAEHGVAGLAAAGTALGLATEIWPHGRWRLDFRGHANHAGTTPLADRHDPMLPFARAVLEVRAAAERHGTLATIGRVQVDPGAANAIAARVTAWVDARGAASDRVADTVADLEGAIGLTATRESWTDSTVFDASLTSALRDLLERSTGTRPPLLPSGAGHDAGVLALAGIPTAMLFVRNPTGVSHSPEEHADDADVATGVDALVAILRERAA